MKTVHRLDKHNPVQQETARKSDMIHGYVEIATAEANFKDMIHDGMVVIVPEGESVENVYGKSDIDAPDRQA